MLAATKLRQIIFTLVVTGTAMVLTAQAGHGQETRGTSPSAMSRRYHYTNIFARDAYEADRRSLRTQTQQDNPTRFGDPGGFDNPPAQPGDPPSPSTNGQAPKTQAQQSGPATSTPGNGPEFAFPFWTEHANQKDDHPGPCTGKCSSPVFRVVKGSDADQKDSFRSAYMAAAFHGLPEGLKPFEGFGIPLTDTSFYAMIKQVSERKQAILNDPMNLMITAKGKNQTQVQLASSATADAAEASFDTNLDFLRQPLINVANEQAGVPTTPNQPSKGVENAVWMVQQMYRTLYLPMALLLLLPGAVLTQFRGLVGFGFMGQTDGDSVNPFSGILRALIALFLIPCTQLIVSYSVDVGNSLTCEIQEQLDPTELLRWAHQQTFDAPMENSRNIYMEPKTVAFTPLPYLSLSVLIPGSPDPMVAGMDTNGPEEASEVEQQSFTTQTMQMILNLINMGFSIGLSMLLGFQTVMMCYLFLLGPIAAALFAWPSGIGVDQNGGGSLFQRVFANWVDAVMTLALWRFWWCVVILVMATRIAWLQDIGGYQPNSQWEVLMYTAFMIILTTVPFLPFDFRPGDMASKALDKASNASNSQGSPNDTGGGDQQNGDRSSSKSKNK